MSDIVFSAKFPFGELNYAAALHSEILRCAKSEIALCAADGWGGTGSQLARRANLADPEDQFSWAKPNLAMIRRIII